MNKSNLFKKAHKIAKASVTKFESYRKAFSYGLKQAYLSLKTNVEKVSAKLKATVSTYKGNFLVKVPFAIKDSFKKAVKARWEPATKEWFVKADQESNLREWMNS